MFWLSPDLLIGASGNLDKISMFFIGNPSIRYFRFAVDRYDEASI